MKRALLAVLILAAPAVAGAQAHGVASGHVPFHDHGLRHHQGHDRNLDDHLVVWGWPLASDNYGYFDPPAPPPCGWSSRPGRDEWSTGPCEPPDPPPRPAW